MDIPSEMYIACIQYTEEDISRIRVGLTKKENGICSYLKRNSYLILTDP